MSDALRYINGSGIKSNDDIIFPTYPIILIDKTLLFEMNVVELNDEGTHTSKYWFKFELTFEHFIIPKQTNH